MPRDLRRHLGRRGAAERVAGVQAAAQAQDIVDVLFDRGVEALQHGQRSGQLPAPIKFAAFVAHQCQSKRLYGVTRHGCGGDAVQLEALAS